MTGLPTEPGSVIGWVVDEHLTASILGPNDEWTVCGSKAGFVPQRLAYRLTDVAWWYMGRVTPDGITTTR